MQRNGSEAWILYSTCDEDSASELRALEIVPGDRVVSVTGSGCRTLSLLARNPRSVVSVDYAPGQNYLLELKLAAIKGLSYDELLAFLGVDPCKTRWKVFESLAPHLSAGAQDYFRRHRWAIEQGVLFSGRHERFYIKLVAPLLGLLYGRRLKRMFAAPTVAEQHRIYRRQIAGRLWRLLIRQGFSERTLRALLHDVKYHIEIDVPSPGDYLLERLDHTFSHHLARENHWVTFMLNGRYSGRDFLPHFLLEENCRAIRETSTELTPVTANLIEYLKTFEDDSVDKFSLSDVTSCIDRREFQALLEQVNRTGRPGARLCYRNFLAKYTIAGNGGTGMRRDDELSAELDRDDLAFAYTFEVATIAPPASPGADPRKREIRGEGELAPEARSL